MTSVESRVGCSRDCVNWRARLLWLHLHLSNFKLNNYERCDVLLKSLALVCIHFISYRCNKDYRTELLKAADSNVDNFFFIIFSPASIVQQVNKTFCIRESWWHVGLKDNGAWYNKVVGPGKWTSLYLAHSGMFLCTCFAFGGHYSARCLDIFIRWREGILEKQLYYNQNRYRLNCDRNANGSRELIISLMSLGINNALSL